jgi:hypothetical protein
MLHKKSREKTGNASHAGVNKVMAKPWIARTARMAGLKLDTARIPEHPSTIRLEPPRKWSRLHALASRKKHKLLLTGPTNGIEISVLKMRWQADMAMMWSPIIRVLTSRPPSQKIQRGKSLQLVKTTA